MSCLNTQSMGFAFLRRTEAASYLRMSRSKLDNLHRLGKGPLRITLPDSRIVIYPLATLHRWVEKQKG
jgi:hypothetical protein